MPPPPGPPLQPAAAGSDRTTLFGWLGIVIGLICCGIAGIVLGILSIQQAKKFNNSPVLGYVAIAASILNFVFGAVYYTSR